MTTDAEVAVVAKRLTKAQQERLCLGGWNVSPYAELYVDELLAERMGMYRIGLTPLGIAVRAHLLAQAGAGERGGV